MKQHYNAIVIGSQLAGLIAASIQAKRGRRVLLIEHEEQADYYIHDGWLLPRYPHILPCLDNSWHAQSVHNELGMDKIDGKHITPLHPGYQVCTPNKRTEVTSCRKRLYREIAHDFPSELEAIKMLLENVTRIDNQLSKHFASVPPLPPVTWRQLLKHCHLPQELRQLNVPYHQHPLFAATRQGEAVHCLFLEPLRFMGYWGDSISALQAVRLIAQILKGCWHIQQPGNPTVKKIYDGLRQSGVDILSDTRVLRIKTKGRNIQNIELKPQQAVSSDYYIANTHAPFHLLLDKDSIHPKYAHDQRKVTASRGLLTLNLVVKRRVVPPAMNPSLFLLDHRDRRGDKATKPTIFIRQYATNRSNTQKQGKHATEDADHIVLSLGICQKIETLEPSTDHRALLQSDLIERVSTVVPFLQDYIVAQSLTFTSPVPSDQPALKTPLAVTCPIHPFYSSKSPPLFGVATRSSQTVYKNLFHCGRDILPGLGVEGEYISGLETANRLSTARRR